jgi:hypothetical protein
MEMIVAVTVVAEFTINVQGKPVSMALTASGWAGYV